MICFILSLPSRSECGGEQGEREPRISYPKLCHCTHESFITPAKVDTNSLQVVSVIAVVDPNKQMKPRPFSRLPLVLLAFGVVGVVE